VSARAGNERLRSTGHVLTPDAEPLKVGERESRRYRLREAVQRRVKGIDQNISPTATPTVGRIPASRARHAVAGEIVGDRDVWTESTHEAAQGDGGRGGKSAGVEPVPSRRTRWIAPFADVGWSVAS